MRAILIDPDTQTVEAVFHDGDFKDIYRLIGADPFDVRPIHGRPGNVVYFDDEFLLRDKAKDYQGYVDIEGLPDPIGGKCLILGTDGGGNSVDTLLEVDEVAAIVSYRRLKVIGWTPVKTETVEQYGKKWNIIRGPRPIFDTDPDPGVKRDPETIFSDQHEYRGAGHTKAQIDDQLKTGGKGRR